MAMPDYIRDVTANMTIQEIRERHVDNFMLLHKHEMSDQWFKTPKEAADYHGFTVGQCMQKLGVDHSKIAHAARLPERDRVFLEKQIQKQIDDKGIEIIDRLNNHKDPTEIMRNGIYILYQNEIAYFVSQVTTVKGHMNNMRIIIPDRIRYLGRTNYKEVI